MQVGNMKVFPNANRKPEFCCMCERGIPVHRAFVHHYKTDEPLMRGRKPKKPSPYRQTYTRQMHFCSLECVTMRGIEGVYEDG